MKTWMWGVIVACLALLAGCGGFSGGRVHLDPCPPALLAENDDLLAAELSGKRLEELYAKSGIPGWDPSLEEELKKWEHQANFDVPIQMNKQVGAYLVYFSTERKDVIRRQLARSTRYLPMIKEVFQEYGLPEDLAYLAMVESGFNPNAYSPAGACGLWQFIKPTGQRYGLVIDGYVDERRDPEKSTRAAAKYLRDLYKQFGSWYLATASYNCGERRVQQELSKSHHKNFWELSANQCLPNETKNYVPQMIAATIIAKHPEKFGFTNVAYERTLTREQMALADSGKNTALAEMGNFSGAPGPVHAPKNSRLSFSQSKSPPIGQASLARQAGQKSASNLKPPQKQTARVARAKGGNSTAHVATKGNSGPYVASLIGSPGPAPRKGAAGKPKSTGQVTANAKKKKSHPAVEKGKSKKPGPVLLAKKSASSSKAKSIKKNSSSPKNPKLARTKSRALLLSEAR